MTKKMRGVKELHLDPSNARHHNDRNIAAIKASLARFGQQTPIVIDKADVVRKGNGTLVAARELGWDKIWAVTSPLDEPELISYAIADNRSAELASWDLEVLEKVMPTLEPESREAAGFTDDELSLLLGSVELEPRDDLEKPIDEGENIGNSLGESIEYSERIALTLMDVSIRADLTRQIHNLLTENGWEEVVIVR